MNQRYNRYHKDICKECTDNKRINTDDVWFFGREELTLQGGSDAVKVNFSEISPAWLKRSAKDFIKALPRNPIQCHLGGECPCNKDVRT